MKNIDLFNTVKIAGIRNENLADILVASVKERCKTVDETQIAVKVKKFLQTLRLKWEKHKRTLDFFEKYEDKWLSNVFLNVEVRAPSPDRMNNNVGGRPSKQWNDLAPRSKRRKASALATSTSTGELTSAAIVRSKSSPGMKEVGKVLKTVAKDPSKVKKILRLH